MRGPVGALWGIVRVGVLMGLDWLVWHCFRVCLVACMFDCDVLPVRTGRVVTFGVCSSVCSIVAGAFAVRERRLRRVAMVGRSG